MIYLMKIFSIFVVPSFSNSFPTFEMTSSFSDDEHIPQTINSWYFTIPEVTLLNTKVHSFSILHTNIRSRTHHHDESISLAALSKKSFHVIGVSEIWDSIKNPIMSNINIPGYRFFKTTSLRQNGDTGLYIKYSSSFQYP